MRDNTKSGGSSGDRPKSRLTTAEALWLTTVRAECIVFIKSQDEKLVREDAEDIFSHEIEVLSKRGFHDLYSKVLRLEIQHGREVSHEENLALLGYHLNRRVIDFFRAANRIKRSHGKRKNLEDYQWNALPDKGTEYEGERRMGGDRLDELRASVRNHLNPKDKAILNAALRNPKGGFNRTSLFEAMTDEERELFQTKDAALVVDEKEWIKKAIAARTADVRRKIRRIIADDPGEGGCDGA